MLLPVRVVPPTVLWTVPKLVECGLCLRWPHVMFHWVLMEDLKGLMALLGHFAVVCLFRGYSDVPDHRARDRRLLFFLFHRRICHRRALYHAGPSSHRKHAGEISTSISGSRTVSRQDGHSCVLVELVPAPSLFLSRILDRVLLVHIVKY